MPRLMVVSWDVPGVCDIASMTDAINAHVRRQDTYHSAFEFENGNIFRRTIVDPEDITFEPVAVGELDAEQISAHALSTTPLADIGWRPCRLNQCRVVDRYVRGAHHHRARHGSDGRAGQLVARAAIRGASSALTAENAPQFAEQNADNPLNRPLRELGAQARGIAGLGHDVVSVIA
jgi:hypothetical protein